MNEPKTPSLKSMLGLENDAQVRDAYQQVLKRNAAKCHKLGEKSGGEDILIYAGRGRAMVWLSQLKDAVFAHYRRLKQESKR